MSDPTAEPWSRLRVTREVRSDSVAIIVAGELDLETSPQLDGYLSELDSDVPQRFLVDLHAVEFMDSTGLRSVLRAQKAAVAHGHELTFRRGTRQVQRLFDLTATTDLLTFEN